MTSHKHTSPPPDAKEEERSAEERNVVAPTPRDVREKAEDSKEPHQGTTGTKK
jgi:hypothetical protein